MSRGILYLNLDLDQDLDNFYFPSLLFICGACNQATSRKVCLVCQRKQFVDSDVITRKLRFKETTKNMNRHKKSKEKKKNFITSRRSDQNQSLYFIILVIFMIGKLRKKANRTRLIIMVGLQFNIHKRSFKINIPGVQSLLCFVHPSINLMGHKNESEILD